MDVIKANGVKEKYSEEKVLSSIQRAGIPKNLQDQVLKHVNSKIYNGIETDEIYHHIKEFLGKSEVPYSKAKYSLKQAIRSLGPTGYPFEDFVARLLESNGYQTKVRTIIMGKCVSHEIDVIAAKENKTTMVEAKFHNTAGIKTDVHVALYTQARFDDVKVKEHFDEVMLATNTKITDDALAYAQCMGMEVLSWDYPKVGSLRELVEKSKLIPITALSSLSMNEKVTLANKGIIFTKNLCSDLACLTDLGLSKEIYDDVAKEAEFLTK